MSKSNLYTRTGDHGTTSLVGGTRVKKNCLRLDSYGTIDEFSSLLGVILSNPDCPDEVRGQLRIIQNMLFNLGGYLACESVPIASSGSAASAATGSSATSVVSETPASSAASVSPATSVVSETPASSATTGFSEGDRPKVWGLKESDLTQLEGWIDALDEQTPKINAFVLPGGCPLCAQAHVARTVCRRAERLILGLAEKEYVDPLLLSYINRLSDYLFILARYFNFISGVEEITWQKTD